MKWRVEFHDLDLTLLRIAPHHLAFQQFDALEATGWRLDTERGLDDVEVGWSE